MFTNACERERCKHYSDYDVYYTNGTSKSLCSQHTAPGFDDLEIEQVVPQHGSDNINQPLPGHEFTGKNRKVEVGVKVIGPCFYKGKVIGYHVKMQVGKNRAMISTMIPVENFLEDDNADT